MSVFPGSANAIVYAQFNLQGRWKRMLIVAGCYGLLLAGAIWLSTLGENYRPRDLQSWAAGIMGLQGVSLLVFGPFRVETAVRGDVSSRMLESHRLMPAPPLGSMLGYIFGAPLQATLLTIVNFILGAVCCAVGGLSLNVWAVANGTLFFFAVFVYAMIAQFSFVARGGFLILLIAGPITIAASQNGGLQMLPAANALLFPLASRGSIFEQLFNRPGSTILAELVFPFATAIVAQGILICVSIRAGVRRYLSNSAIGFSPALGLVVLATWIGLAVVEFNTPEIYRPPRYGGLRTEELVAQTIISFATSFVLAMLPISSSAKASGRQRPVPAIFSFEFLTLIACTAIVGILLTNVPGDRQLQPNASILTLVILFNFLTAVTCIFSWGYLRRRRAWIFAGIWVVVTWLGPVIADAVCRQLANSNSDNPTWITALSPAGALAMIWSDSPVVFTAGIEGQIAITLLPMALVMLAQRKSPAVIHP